MPALIEFLDQEHPPAVKLDVLSGMRQALRGQAAEHPPARWPAVRDRLISQGDDRVRCAALLLGAQWRDAAAISELRALIRDPDVALSQRVTALKTLSEQRVSELPDDLLLMLNEPAMACAALRALARYDDPRAPRRVLATYHQLQPAARREAIPLLAARPASAKALCAALEGGTIRPADVPVYAVRQIHALHDLELSQRLQAAWGEVRATAAEKQRKIAVYRSQLSPSAIEAADQRLGRQVFQRACSSCHRLFGEGHHIGPDLTGADRRNLDYLLENVVDPSAAIDKDHQLTIIHTHDGRVLSGMILAEHAGAVTIQMLTDEVQLATSDIELRQHCAASMMPEGLLDQLSQAERAALFAYLMSD